MNGAMLDAITVILLVAGLFFFFSTTVGIIRFPDFYSRMHAAGKGDVLSSVLMLLGLALYNLHHLSVSTILTSLKIISITGFIFLASPTATHAIIDAGYESGVRPWGTGGGDEESDDDLAT